MGDVSDSQTHMGGMTIREFEARFLKGEWPRGRYNQCTTCEAGVFRSWGSE